MARIRQLDAHVADLIAAGEVVERPASVIKELMENAVDAGASQITVEIQHGGMALMRVTDNGGGIAPEDVETAFLRHATSKLRTAQDLEAIGTLGFRGEALAAIAAVSRIELLTRTEAADFGTSLSIEGGVVRAREETGCPLGTTMVVRDLFFNTPARQKFMKRDAAEGAAVFALVQRMALAHPEVSVKFLRDGKQELLTPGDAKLSSALYSVFGRDIALGFTEVKGTGEEMEVAGFVTLPACCRGTRGYQHFILNGRPIKSRLLTAAVEEAYQNQKMVGKFPGCVLQIRTKLGAVDVNVHPAKTEVKFLSDKKIFDGVYYTVLSALGGERRHPSFKLPDKPQLQAGPGGKGGFQSLTAQQFRDSMGGGTRVIAPTAPPKAGPAVQMSAWDVASASIPAGDQVPVVPVRKESPSNPAAPSLSDGPGGITASAPTVGLDRPVQEGKCQETDLTPITPLDLSANQITAVAPQEEAPVLILEEELEQPWRIAAEVLNTYLIIEQGDTILLIDKHAAHERMIFDQMKAGEYKPMSQSLLEPLVLTPTPEEATALLGQLPLLEEFGFLVEDFGGGTLVVRQLPFDLAVGEAEETLCQLATALLEGKQQNPDGARDHLLHTIACKAAIKGGQKNAPEELLPVARAVLSGQVKYCPHGRPVAITLTRSQLERQFGRS